MAVLPSNALSRPPACAFVGRSAEAVWARTQPYDGTRSLFLRDPPEALARVDEAELIERVLAGDMSAARRLYDTYVGGVHRLAIRMTADDALAQDATQDAFVRVFRSLPGFRRDAAAAEWPTCACP